MHYVDIARGIAIILVVIGHGISEYGTGFTALEKVIYSFHMPLFFVISGLVFRVKDGVTLGAFAKKRAKGLMLPYLLFAGLILLSHIAEKLVLKADVEFFEQLKTPSGILNTLLLTTKSAFSNLWFLPCMLAAQLLLFAILKYVKNKAAQAVLCTVLSLAVIFLSPQLALPLCLETAVASLLFLYLGTIIAEKKLLDKGKYILTAVSLAWFAAAEFVFLHFFKNDDFSYYNVQFDVPWLFVFTAISGSLLIIGISYLVKKCAVLELLGQHSLYIFGFHYLVQNIIRIAFEKAGMELNKAIMLAVATILNLAVCTLLSVLWGRIKNVLFKKESRI